MPDSCRAANNGDQISEMHMEDGFSIALNRCGRHAAIGNCDGMIQIWKTEESPELRKRWKSHEDTVLSLSFSFDGTRIVSYGADDFIRIWDTQTEREIGCIQEDEIFDVAVSADGNFIIHTNWPISKIWDVHTKELVFHSGDFAACPQRMSKSEAWAVLHNSGPKSSYMGQDWLGPVAGDLFFEQENVYYMEGNGADSLNAGKKKHIAIFPEDTHWWESSSRQSTLVTVLHGRLLIFSRSEIKIEV